MLGSLARAQASSTIPSSLSTSLAPPHLLVLGHLATAGVDTTF